MNIIVFVLFSTAVACVLKAIADRRNTSFPLLVAVFWTGAISAFGWAAFWLRFCL